MQSLKHLLFLTGLCFLFLFSGSLQAAEGLIEKVNFQGKDGNSESVIFHLNGPHLPKAFALKGENPRVVFDFMGTSLARSVPSAIAADGSMVRKIRMGRHDKRTRVVIDLVPGGQYRFEQNFDEARHILTIELFSADMAKVQKEVPAAAEEEEVVPPEPVTAEEELEPAVNKEEPVAEDAPPPPPVVAETPELEAEEPEPAAPAVPAAAESGPSPDPLLSRITFEDTANKGEMVLFELNGFYPPVVSGEEDGSPRVICEFAGTRLAKDVEKKKVSNGRYVTQIRVEELDDNDSIRVTLDLVPNKNYDLQQVFFKEDNLFVIIVNSYDDLSAPAN